MPRCSPAWYMHPSIQRQRRQTGAEGEKRRRLTSTANRCNYQKLLIPRFRKLSSAWACNSVQPAADERHKVLGVPHCQEHPHSVAFTQPLAQHTQCRSIAVSRELHHALPNLVCIRLHRDQNAVNQDGSVLKFPVTGYCGCI